MRSRQIRVLDEDVRKISTSGYLVVPLVGEPALLEDIAGVLQAGLASIRHSRELRETLLRNKRENKDPQTGQLRVGYYETIEDDMAQFNFSDYHDALAVDCLRLEPSLKDFFAALNTVSELMRRYTYELAIAIDILLAKTGCFGLSDTLSVRHIIADARCITSAMDYIPKLGNGLTNARPNTAAMAAYLLATNPGMQVIDRFDRIHDLSSVEKDPSQVLFIPGTQLASVTQNFIAASRHPIIPNKLGARRFSLRFLAYTSGIHSSVD